MKTKFLTTLMIFASLMIFVGCDTGTDTDDETSNLNASELALVGSWTGTVVGQGSMQTDFDSDQTYAISIVLEDMSLFTIESGTWSATATVVTMISTPLGGVSDTTVAPYTLSGNELTVTIESMPIIFTKQ